MSNYTKTTNFAAKDSLPSGNAAKIVKGTEIDTEFNNIATASATKANTNNAALTGTTTFETISDGTIAITAFVDEDNMASDSATLLPTQQSVKAYVDSQVTAQDLDVTDGSTSIDIDLDSESLGILGGTGIDSTASGTGVTLAIDSTVATLTGSQTLSNKTLSTPVVSGNLTTDGLLDGRDVAADGTKLDGIESGATADQTAAEIKTAYESNANTNAFTDADESKLDGIEASADVTDTANVTAAGALMDSELTSEASVKALNQGVATTDSPTFAGVTAPVTGNVTGNLTGNVTGNVTGDVTGDLTGDVTGNVTGNLTGSVLTAAQTNITSVGTLGSLTVSGDVTVDTNTLKVDSTNNRVGLLNASPDVTLDVGSATDAVHVPTGTTAQRPTGAAGYFRYNSTLEQFEGYTDAWGAIGGGGGSNLVSDTMTGDGVDTTLTLSNDPLNENNTQVYIDGVYQNKDTYSVSGTTLTFSTAPPSGSAVEAMTIQPTAVNVPADASVTSAKLSGDLVTPGALDVTGTATMDGLSASASTTDYIASITNSNGSDAGKGLFVSTRWNTAANSVAKFVSNSGANAVANFAGNGDISFYNSSGTSQSLFWDASAESLGINVTDPIYPLEVQGEVGIELYNASGGGGVLNLRPSLGDANKYNMSISSYDHSGGGTGPADGISINAFDGVSIATGSSTARQERLRIDQSGRVGIGTTSPANDVQIKTTTNGGGLTLQRDSVTEGDYSQLSFVPSTSDSADPRGWIRGHRGSSSTNTYLTFGTDNTERMRIDSSGRVSVGTKAWITSDANVGYFGGNDTQSNHISFYDSLNLCRIYTNGSERMRIDSSGNLFVGGTAYEGSTTSNASSAYIASTGFISANVTNDFGMQVNRTGTDGTLVNLRKNGADVGSISVSGSTVSYNPFMGSHYSETADTGMLFGTVMEATGDLVENQYTAQKRLTKTQVSTTSESAAVYGVWISAMEGGGETIAAVGASWCRINSSATVAVGDLLTSNGDGTAKVQSDDIIRSKTIGKVTSTTIKETHADGSYVVPVVLYCG